MFNIWIRVFTYWFMMYVKDWRHNSAKLIGRRVRAVCGWIDVWLFMSLFIYLYLLFNFWVSEWLVYIYIHIFTDKCVLSICGWIDVKLFMLLLGYLIFIVFFSLFIYSFIHLCAIYMWVNRRQTLHVAICLWNIHFCFVFVFIYIFVRYLYVGESTSNSSCCYSFF